MWLTSMWLRIEEPAASCAILLVSRIVLQNYHPVNVLAVVRIQ